MLYKKRKFSLLVNQFNLFRSGQLCLLGYERTGSVWHPQRSRLISLSLLDKQPVLRPISPGILTHPLAFYPELLGRQSCYIPREKGKSQSCEWYKTDQEQRWKRKVRKNCIEQPKLLSFQWSHLHAHTFEAKSVRQEQNYCTVNLHKGR